MNALILGVTFVTTYSSVALTDPPHSYELRRSVSAQHDDSKPSSAPPSGTSPAGWNINLVDAVEVGSPYSILIDGAYAYVGYNRLLTILDIQNPALPTKVGFAFLLTAPYEIQRSENILYCTMQVNSNNFLQILDISDPTAPFVLTTMPTQGYEMDVENERLYIEHGEGIRVYDISTPASPVLRGFCASGGVTDLLARDNFVYVAQGVAIIKGLQIIDASNPAAPIQTAFLSMNDGAYAIDLAGSHIFANGFFGGFHVIDISNTASPTVVASRPGSFLDVAVRNNHAYLLAAEGVQRYDVTNPVNPVALPIFVPCDAWYPYPMDLSNETAVIADGGYGVCLVDISDPNSLTTIGSYNSIPAAYSAEIAGGHVLISMYGHLLAMNRYDPYNRTFINGRGGTVDGSQVAVRGDYAYVAMSDSWYNSSDRLEIFDVSNPAAATSVGWIRTPWFPEPLSVGQGFVYLATYTGLWIVDVINPVQPIKVGELAVQFFDLFASEPYLFGITSGNFRVLDVSNPNSPVFVATLPLAGNPSKLWVDGGFAYVTSQTGLIIVDISNPIMPSISGSFPTSNLRNVRSRGDYAYLTERDYVRILDVSNPVTAVEVGNIAATDVFGKLAVAPPYIYAVTGGPLLVFETPLMTGTTSGPNATFKLKQNFPNPFNPSTTITFELSASTRARVDVFDVRGRLVRMLFEQSMAAGTHTSTWDGRDENGIAVSSGIYFYRLTANGRSEAKKMVMLK